jgi:hypothetical protein
VGVDQPDMTERVESIDRLVAPTDTRDTAFASGLIASERIHLDREEAVEAVGRRDGYHATSVKLARGRRRVRVGAARQV